MSDDLADLSARDLARCYERRECSPVEVVRSVLTRLERTDPIVHAIVAVAAERALAEAQHCEDALVRLRSTVRPALFGVPITVKGHHPTEGIVTTRGSRRFASFVPTLDAVAVEGSDRPERSSSPRRTTARVAGRRTPTTCCSGLPTIHGTRRGPQGVRVVARRWPSPPGSVRSGLALTVPGPFAYRHRSVAWWG